jgi:hypothetical protein
MKAGTRVRYIGRDFDIQPEGIVHKARYEGSDSAGALVVFDFPHKRMHDGGIGCESRCWYCMDTDLIVLKEEERKVIGRGKVEVKLDGV